jgi:hypothetical protein
MVLLDDVVQIRRDSASTDAVGGGKEGWKKPLG